MALPWLRLYTDFQDNARVQDLSEVMQRRLIMLFISRRKLDKLTDKIVSFQWRMPLEQVVETKLVFIEAGFIDADWNIFSWDERQPPSDSSAARVKKHRGKVTPSAPLQKRDDRSYSNSLDKIRQDEDIWGNGQRV